MYRPLGEAAPGRPLPVNEEVRVLHVEDDSHMAAMYRLGLEMAGFSVTAARDADRALEALERDSFDLLLLDIQLPGTSGLDLLLTLRRMAAIQAVPAVILTNEDDPELRQLAMRRGATSRSAPTSASTSRPIQFTA